MLFTVLGASGFIGAHLVRHLRAAGVDCQAPGARRHRLAAAPASAMWVYAIGLTADFRARPLDTVEAHVCLLRRLLAEGDFDSLTYLSSTRVYSGAAATDESARLVVDPNAPGDLYNLSKLMGESLCLHGGPAAHARGAAVTTSWGLRPDPDIFIDQLLDEGLPHRPCAVAHVTGLVQGLPVDRRAPWQLLARMAVSDQPGIFNVASGEAVSNARASPRRSNAAWVFP